MAVLRNKTAPVQIIIDMEEFERLKEEIVEIVTLAEQATVDANEAADRLKAVNKELNKTIGKLIASRRP